MPQIADPFRDVGAFIESNFNKRAEGKQGESSHHAVHEDELEFVLVEGLVAVLVVGSPDVAGDGSGHSSVCVAVTGVRQEGAFVVQQAARTERRLFITHKNNTMMKSYSDKVLRQTPFSFQTMKTK